ncbi:MAG TPA: hypothetical protein VF681_11800 [Abditibacteriaceae bacterium]|jgi:hypothetical protein
MNRTASCLLAFPLFAAPLFAAESPKQTLPLRDVVLFSSGVGYFGREGKVDGNAQVDLTIRAPQLADILKSLVILDPGGKAQPVTYSIDDWLARRPNERDLKVDASASPGAILRGFQGAAVRLEKEKGAVEGRVVSVSEKQVKIGDDWISVEVVTLATKEGLATVRLDDVVSFRLVDPALDAKLRASLEKLASNMTARLDDGARTVSLRFAGKGTRDVRAGYLLETPVWKTSYRLVLDKTGKPFLQGWAIVENTSDEDWNDVRMTLVSGQPVSFVQDLAAPLYVARPVIAPPVQGSARPQTYGAGYGSIEPGVTFDNEAAALNGVRGPAGPESRVTALENRAAAPARLSVTPGFLHRSGSQTYINNLADTINRANMGTGDAQATGEARGELFAYSLDSSLDLPRGKASMVPIVSNDVAGEAVSIVVSNGQSVGELAPSNGFSLKNITGAHLQGGPVTVFDGGIYAGDALIGNVVPNETRLLSYAADLELLARLDKLETTTKLLHLSAANGKLVASYGYLRTRTFLLKNKSVKAKTVIVQIPDENGYKLSDPKQLDEKSADGLRFRVAVEPKKSRLYDIRSETSSSNLFVLSELNNDQITGFLRETAASPAMKAALQEILNRRAKISALAAQRAAQEEALKDIEADQNRIRENMARLSEGSALYKKYVAKLTTQEERVDAVREEIVRLRGAEAETQKALRNYLENLDIEK